MNSDAISQSIAIIGMDCTFPGASNTREFWENLINAHESLSEFTDEELIDSGVKPEQFNDPDYVRKGFVINDEDLFDASFFGYSPKEAEVMDPQHRLFLESVWKTFEDSGYRPSDFEGDIGVFAGSKMSTYLLNNLAGGVSGSLEGFRTLISNDKDYLATRISYKLNLSGPSVTVQSACSTSLVAVHLACESLLSGACDMAVAGGSAVLVPQKSGYMYQKGMILSPDGHCRAFDDNASGIAPGNGVGAVLLKRLEDALEDGDQIYAVIRGSAMNNDGAQKTGYTSPGVEGQAAVVSEAQVIADVDPETISYIETHGTGTPLGDPIEIAALSQVFQEKTDKKNFCAIGSVKTNIGHLDTAAGVASLIKASLAVKNRMIPPSINFHKANEKIDFQSTPFYVNDKLQKWDCGENKLRAGVSSFGFGGTNVHLILEEAPETETDEPALKQSSSLVTLSAKNILSLKEMVNENIEFLKKDNDLKLEDIAFTLNCGRTDFPLRFSASPASKDDFIVCLEKYLDDLEKGRVKETPGKNKNIVFMFTGQGSQYFNMGRELFDTQPVFQETMKKCDEFLEPLIGDSILEIIYNEDKTYLLNTTEFTQPALFSIEYSLAKMWMSWGVNPDFVMGHSVGEYVAAVISGVLSLEDGLKLISSRGRLMQNLPGGAMAAVFSDEKSVGSAIDDLGLDISMAAVNGPDNIVISGDDTSIVKAVDYFSSKDVGSHQLKVSHAFHSSMMEEMKKDFLEVLETCDFSKPEVPVISNLTGRIEDNENLFSKDYWCEHITSPVLFYNGMKSFEKDEKTFFLELGPSNTLINMAKKFLDLPGDNFLPSLTKGKKDFDVLNESLASIYRKGFDLSWGGIYQGFQFNRVSVPGYCFQRKRFWIKPGKTDNSNDVNHEIQNYIHPVLGIKIDSPFPIFKSRINQYSPEWIGDHVLYGKPVFPATGFIDASLCAGNELFPGKIISILNLNIFQPLILDGENTDFVFSVKDKTAANADFQIFSKRMNNESEWSLHAEGSLAVSSFNHENKMPEVFQKDGSREVSLDFLSERGSSLGMVYGPWFSGLKQVFTDGEMESFGKIDFSEEGFSPYKAHPGLLDSCLQVLGGFFEEKKSADSVHMPISFEKITIPEKLNGNLYCRGVLRDGNKISNKTFTIDFFILDKEGVVKGEIMGLVMKQAPRKLIENAIRNDLPNSEQLMEYGIKWKKTDIEVDEKDDFSKSWIILSSFEPDENKLYNYLNSSGGDVTCQNISFEDDCLDEKIESELSKTEELIKKADAKGQDVVELVFFSRSENNEDLNIQKKYTDCRLLLFLIRLVSGSDFKSRINLSIVTCGARRVCDDEKLGSLFQSSVWGMSMGIEAEHPELTPVVIDIDPVEHRQDIEDLVKVINSSRKENRISIRKRGFYCPRLFRQSKDFLSMDGLKIPLNKPWQLDLDGVGIDNLRLKDLNADVGKGRLKVRVVSSSLNFRDVLISMGLYPDKSAKLGMDFSGIVTELGEDTKGFKVGDRVAGTADGCFASHVIASVGETVKIPDNLDFESASALPSAFMAAIYSLEKIGKLQKGESVLIHAASGGVGIAAVQYALDIGAEVYATAGNDAKREYLKKIGVKHVFNSRTLDFKKEILELTADRGVDVVLNSLTGDFIEATFSVTAENGRFLELGSRGIWSVEEAEEYRKDINYSIINMADSGNSDRGLSSSILNSIMEKIESKSYLPLPIVVFPVNQVISAFRYMSETRHIGKITISFGNFEPEEKSFSRGTRIITGGLGGIGINLASWLVDNGVKDLVLMGRSRPSQESEEIINDMRSKGGNILVVNTDVSDYSAMEKAFCEINEKMPRIKGVFHLAGVLSDNRLEELDWEDFLKVFSPKIGGAWNLHKLTENLVLDEFVLFSSMATLFKSHGQSNYAAANEFLDSLAEFRRSRGLAGAAIDWGVWSQSGAAVELLENNSNGFRKRLNSQGIGTIDNKTGFDSLKNIISRQIPRTAVVDVNWEAFFNARSDTEIPLLVEDFSGKHGIQSSKKDAFSGISKISDPEELNGVLKKYLMDKISKTLNLNKSEITETADLIQLGMDSLMFLDLTQTIGKELKIKVAPGVIFENPTIEALSELFTAKILDDNNSLKVLDEEIMINPEPEKKYLPFDLTEIQQAYRIGRSSFMSLGNVACYVYFETDINDLDLKLYSDAWNRLIKHHDMLRCIFPDNGKQQILESVPDFSIKVNDFSGEEYETKEIMLDKIRKEMSQQVIDIRRWPLFDVKASVIDEKTTRIHTGIDLLIADVYSIRLMLNELSELYSGNNNIYEKPLTLSFRDYVNAEFEERKGTRYSDDKDYWLKRKDTLPDHPDLPVVPVEKRKIENNFTRRDFSMEKKDWDKIKEMCKNNGITPSAILLTAYSLVLSKWSRNKDFSLNLTFFNRKNIHEEVSSIVGDFTSVLLLEVKNSKGLSFVEAAKIIQKQLWDDMEHRSYSGIEMLREISRGEKDKKIMPVVFTSNLVYKNDGDENSGMKTLGKLVYNVSQTPQVWIDNQASEDNGKLLISWDCSESVFPDGLLDEMFSGFKKILFRLAYDQQTVSCEVSKLMPARKSRAGSIVAKGSKKKNMLHTLFADNAEKFPDKTAITTSSMDISYENLHKLAQKLSIDLQKNGAAPNSVIAVVMDKGWEQIAAVMGILYSGAAYLPIDASFPEERIETLLEDGGVNVVVVQSRLKSRFDFINKYKSFFIDEKDYDLVKDSDFGEFKAIQDEDDLAYLIYTSGSTGKPKGVMINHSGAVNTIADINERFDIGFSDKAFGVSSLSFDLSVYDIFGMFAAGGSLVIPDGENAKNPSHWLDLVNKEGVTLWNSVPTIFEMLLDYAQTRGKEITESLRTILLSGDWVSPRLPGRVKHSLRDVNLISLGGATEASIWSILYPIEQVDPEWKSIPYGKPMKDQDVVVLDDDLEECLDWVTGNIFIGGKGLAMGYWNDSVKTDASFIIHPESGERLYKTGDLGRYMPDGNIEFLGRNDFQVKVRGHRVELGEIESVLRADPGVKDVVVLLANGKLTGYLINDAEEESADNNHDDPAGEMLDKIEKLGRNLSKKLPSYMVPETYIFVESFPLTENGKIDRKALALINKGSVSEIVKNKNTSPGNDTEKELVDLWCRLLDRSDVGIKDNFFELGGDSLLITKLLNEMHLRFASGLTIELTLNHLFEYPTISEIAEFINANTSANKVDTCLNQVSPIVSLKPSGDQTPLFLVSDARGNPFSYIPLISHISEDQPCYGLQVNDPDWYSQKSTEIKDIAEKYIEAILSIQPDGPYCVGGYCLGGAIAHEIGCQLEKMGKEVQNLLLINSYKLPFIVDDDLVMFYFFCKQTGVELADDNINRITPVLLKIIEDMAVILADTGERIPLDDIVKERELGDELEDIYYQLKHMELKDLLMQGYESGLNTNNKLFRKIDFNKFSQMYKIFKSSVIKAANFKSSLFPGRIDFFRAEGDEIKRPIVFKNSENGHLEVHSIEGTHQTCMKEENIEGLAGKINSILSEVHQEEVS